MIIKRAKPKLFGKGTKARAFGLTAVALLTMSSVSAVQAQFQTIPGMRGKSVSISLDAPKPFNPYSIGVYGQEEAPLTAAGGAIPDVVPMPDMMDPSLYGFDATPTGGPSTTPYVMPKSTDTGYAATPFTINSGNPLDSLRAAVCLTTAIYYEAASESDDGQRGVAQVILNRVKHPAWPNSVCGVVYQGSDKPGCQFSYACDGSMARRPSVEGWLRASRVARSALAGYVHPAVGLATFYHTPQVNPIWNRRLITTAVIGNHIFFRMPGSIGAKEVFAARYSGNEPVPAPKPRAYVAPKPTSAGAAVPLPGSPAAIGAPMPAAPVPMVDAQPQAGQWKQPAAQRPSVQQDNRYVQGALPESDINPAYRDSGKWIR